MQIVRANPLISSPLVQEPAREHHTREQAALPLQPSAAESRQTARAIEDIQSAERMLERRQRSEDSQALMSREGRQQRGVAVYQSLQQSEERAYVSEVLGIDVYA